MVSTNPIGVEDGLNHPASFHRVVAASRKRLFGIFDDPKDGLAAVAALPGTDLIHGEEVWLLHGEEGRRRLDAAGAHHGMYGRLVRVVQMATSDDNRYIDALDRALGNGALVVALPVRDMRTADRLAEGLQRAGGHSFAYTAHHDFVPTLGEI